MMQDTLDMLKDMRMSAMRAELERQENDPVLCRELSAEERISLLVCAEWNRKQSNRVRRLITNACFPLSSATMEGVEYFEDRHLDRVKLVKLSACGYIAKGRHIILKGAAGAGKTYLACALGTAACRCFKKVLFIRMPELLDSLRIARNSGDLQKLLKEYRKADLLIIDEWLIRKLTPEESYDLLEIMESRCGKEQSRSMILCTQYDTEEWYERISPNQDGESTISDAILDRIIHNAHDILLEGAASMRERHGLKAALEAGEED